VTLWFESLRAGSYFLGSLPLALAFLQGRFVDLGFENLGLAAMEYRALRLGFAGAGTCIRDTSFRMRCAESHAAIEPTDGSETATLPATWIGRKSGLIRPPASNWSTTKIPAKALLRRSVFGDKKSVGARRTSL